MKMRDGRGLKLVAGLAALAGTWWAWQHANLQMAWAGLLALCG